MKPLGLAVACSLLTVAWSAVDSSLAHTTKKLSAVKKGRYEFYASYPVFQGSSPTVKTANAHFAAEAQKALKIGHQAIKDGMTGDLLYSMDFSVDIGVARTDLISACINYGDFMGGAHPNHTFKPATFGVINGKSKRLKLIDLCKSAQARDLIKTTIVMPKLQAQKKKRDGALDWEFPDQAMEQFLVTPGGITWLFPPYMVGPYVEGDYTIKVLFSELGPYIKQDGALKTLFTK